MRTYTLRVHYLDPNNKHAWHDVKGLDEEAASILRTNATACVNKGQCYRWTGEGHTAESTTIPASRITMIEVV